jgi:hypothetical protein
LIEQPACAEPSLILWDILVLVTSVEPTKLRYFRLEQVFELFPIPVVSLYVLSVRTG